MAAEKTDAIVLRVVEFSESSCIVTLMTREFGKITALAKGARRRKSPFEAALDVLALCRIVFLRKSSGAMELMTEAKLDRRFRSASTDLDRLYAGYYVAELLNILTDDSDPHPDVFQLADETIKNLDSDFPVAETLVRFEMAVLSLLGHQPILDRCAGCGLPRNDRTRVSFGLNAGGVLCQNCRAGQNNIVRLSSESWIYLNELSQTIASNEFRFDTKLNEEWPRGEVRQVLNKYISHLVGFRPRLQKYITNIA